MAGSHLFLTGLVSGLGLAAPLVYFGKRLMQGDPDRDREPWAQVGMLSVFYRRRRRRTLGMSMMAVISVVFFIGANFVNPTPHPHASLLFWVVLLILLVWLCVLAMMDLAEVGRLRRRLIEVTQEKIREELLACRRAAESQENEDA